MATVRNDLLDRIRDLERQVKEIAGRAQTRPPLDQIRDGNVQISEGGQITVTPPDKEFATFVVGEFPDGAFGTVLRRMDGSYALTVEGEKDDRGTVRIWSRAIEERDRVLVMDDKHSPRHLGRPWLPLQLHPTADQSTNSMKWAHAWVGITPTHNPVAHLHVTSYAEAGGHVRVRMRAEGTAARVLDEWEIPAGEWTDHTITEPLHRTGFLDDLGLQVEHCTDARRQPIETRVLAAYTRNTFAASEAPDSPAGDEGDAPTRERDPLLPVERSDEDDDQDNDNN